jgi:hypothetical protein
MAPQLGDGKAVGLLDLGRRIAHEIGQRRFRGQGKLALPLPTTTRTSGRYDDQQEQY